MNTLLTVCLDRKSGSVLWRREAPRTRALYVDERNGSASSKLVTELALKYDVDADGKILLVG